MLLLGATAFRGSSSSTTVFISTVGEEAQTHRTIATAIGGATATATVTAAVEVYDGSSTVDDAMDDFPAKERTSAVSICR